MRAMQGGWGKVGEANSAQPPTTAWRACHAECPHHPLLLYTVMNAGSQPGPLACQGRARLKKQLHIKSFSNEMWAPSQFGRYTHPLPASVCIVLVHVNVQAAWVATPASSAGSPSPRLENPPPMPCSHSDRNRLRSKPSFKIRVLYKIHVQVPLAAIAPPPPAAAPAASSSAAPCL
jgi:hypothetical protein